MALYKKNKKDMYDGGTFPKLNFIKLTINLKKIWRSCVETGEVPGALMHITNNKISFMNDLYKLLDLVLFRL